MKISSYIPCFLSIFYSCKEKAPVSENPAPKIEVFDVEMANIVDTVN